MCKNKLNEDQINSIFSKIQKESSYKTAIDTKRDHSYLTWCYQILETQKEYHST